MRNTASVVAESVRQALARGEFEVGAAFHSVRQFARAYAVSHVTADRIIKSLIQQGYLEPRSHRPPLVRNKPADEPRLFGVVYFRQTDEHHPNMLRLMQALSRPQSDRGHQLQLIPIDEDGYAELDAFIQYAGESRQLGLLLMALPLMRDQVVRLRDRQIPTVSLSDVPIFRNMGWPIVSIDGADLANQAVDHLVAAGRKRIAAVLGPYSKPWELGTTAHTFFERLRHHNLPAEESRFIRVDAWSAHAGEAATRQLMERVDFDGLLVVDDINAVGAIRALQSAGRSIPGDVAIVGAGDLLHDHFGTELTTFDVRVDEIAAEAVRMLERACDGMPAHGHRVLLKPRLIVRHSTSNSQPIRAAANLVMP